MINMSFWHRVVTVLLFAAHLFEGNGVCAKFVKLNDMAWMRGRQAAITHNTPQYVVSNHLQSYRDSGKLAVFIPFPYSMEKAQLNTLHCTLTKLFKHIAQTTDSAVYLFVHEPELSAMNSWLGGSFPGVSALPIDEESWITSSTFSNVTASPYIEAPLVDPYLLSKWKLSFAPDLAKELGFKYLMIVEADAIFMNTIDFNIVQQFTTQGIALGYRHKAYKASEKSVAGLAELAKFWMITRNILAPPGTLYEHFTPSDIFHVDTASWNRHIYQDPFVVINLDFWYEEPVQNFLHLVFTSGGELLRTWKSQAVYTMVRLLFLQDTQVHAFHQSTVLYDPIADDRLYKYIECTVIADTHDTAASDTQQIEAAPVTATASAVAAITTLEVELPIMLQSVGIEVLPPHERLRELFLFHWQFNPQSCGADTPLVNNYTQYLVEADAMYLRANLWWHKHRVDAQLESLIANKVYVDLIYSQYNSDISDSGNMPRQVCKDILEQQLAAFVRFFCSYGFQGRKMAGYEDGLLRAALARFNTMWN